MGVGSSFQQRYLLTLALFLDLFLEWWLTEWWCVAGDQLNSFELPGGQAAGVWSHNKVARQTSWDMGPPGPPANSNENGRVPSAVRARHSLHAVLTLCLHQVASSWDASQAIGGDVSGNSSSWGDVGGAVGGSSGGGSAWGGSSGVQAGPPGMQISKGHLGHQIGGGSGWGSAAPQPQENNSRNSVWDGPVQTNNTWAGSGNNQQGGVPQPVWGAGGMGGGMW